MLCAAVAMVGSLSLLAAEATGSPHVLVAAAEALVQRDQAEAAQIVIRAALASPGLTRTERARLRLADAVRLSSANDEAGAKKQIDDALNLDPAVSFAFPVKEQLQALLEDLRSMHPPPQAPPPSAPIAVQRERPATSLLRVVDLLGSGGLYDAADSVLQLGWKYGPFEAKDEGALMTRRGAVKVNLFDDEEAQRALHRALELDHEAKLPDWAPPKTARQFDEMRKALPPSLPPSPPPPSVPQIAKAAPSPPPPQAAKPAPPEGKEVPSATEVQTPPQTVAKQTRSSPGASRAPARPPAQVDVRPSALHSESAGVLQRPWLWAVIGGGVLEGAGGILYLLAKGQYDLLATHSLSITGDENLRATANAGRALQVGAVVLLGAGAVGLVGSLALYQQDQARTLSATIQVSAGSFTVSLSGALP